MSKLKLNAASGGGSVSFEGPASSGADSVLKIPSTTGSAGQSLKVASANHSSTNAEIEFGYATEVDMWQQTTDTTTSSQILTANWARSDATATGSYQTYGRIGTGMTESSGVFTFPSTGIWQIRFSVMARHSTAARRWMTGHILATKDNSNYVDTYFAYSSIHAGGGVSVYGNSVGMTLFDVTSTANCKVKFKVTAEGEMVWVGDDSNGQPYTFAIFTRLGDT